MNSLIKKSLHYCKPYKWYFLLSLILAVTFSISNTFFLPLVKDIINEIKNKNMANFNNHILNAVLLYALRLISQYGQYYLMNKTGDMIAIDIRGEIYSKIQRVSQLYFQKYKTGDLITRLGSDTAALKEALVLVFWEIIPNMLTLMGILGYLFYLNWKLTAFSLLSVPVFIVLSNYLGNLLKRFTEQIQIKNANIGQIVQDTLNHIQIIQAYHLEPRFSKRYRNENYKNLKTTLKSIRVRNTVEALMNYLQFLLILGIVWFGGYQMAAGNLEGSAIISFFVGIFLMVDPVMAMSKSYNSFNLAKVAEKRVDEILDLPEDIQTPVNPIKMTSAKGEIEFRNVSFHYEGEENSALSNVNFTAKPGEVIALVGESGAGKSTLINLLMRFFDPSQGDVFLDGVNVKSLDLPFFRSQFSIVPQESMIFNGTLLENIRLGKPNAKFKEVEDAARNANAWDFIESKPEKLLSKTGNQGNQLSGGQRQRISIARALVRQPRILILDEATSALDAKSERLVQDALERCMKGRTVFIIAHRLSTVKNADKIIVLEDGCVTEIGSHNELLDRGGKYAYLYNLQFDPKP
jgi:subfamily B ATP-binding cassette protein MsbA